DLECGAGVSSALRLGTSGAGVAEVVIGVGVGVGQRVGDVDHTAWGPAGAGLGRLAAVAMGACLCPAVAACRLAVHRARVVRPGPGIPPPTRSAVPLARWRLTLHNAPM